MAIMTVYSNASNYYTSTSTVYSSMQTGTGVTNTTTGQTVFCGQVYNNPNYSGYVADYNFDTSALPNGATITSASFNIGVASLSSNTNVYFRYFQQTAWTRGSVLATKPLCASTLMNSAGPKTLTTTLPDTYISKTGTTYICCTTDAFEVESGGTFIYLTYSSNNDAVYKPYFTINYDVPIHTANAFFTPVSTLNMQSATNFAATTPAFPRVAAKDRSIPNAWTRCTGTMSGPQASNIVFNDYNFPFGTSYVKPVFMLNAGDYGSGTTYASNIVFRRKPY